MARKHLIVEAGISQDGQQLTDNDVLDLVIRAGDNELDGYDEEAEEVDGMSHTERLNSMDILLTHFAQ